MCGLYIYTASQYLRKFYRKLYLTNQPQFSMVYLTNRFHVALRLSSNRSQMFWMFLPHFDVLCYLLLNRPKATWNLFVSYNDQRRKKTDTHTYLVPLDWTRICASLGILLCLKRYFFSSLLPFYFILLVYSFFEKFFNVFSCSKRNNCENILQNSESLVAMTHDGNYCEDFCFSFSIVNSSC